MYTDRSNHFKSVQVQFLEYVLFHGHIFLGKNTLSDQKILKVGIPAFDKQLAAACMTQENWALGMVQNHLKTRKNHPIRISDS